MPATPSRIAFITQPTRNVVASDAAVKTKYGELARDTKDEPVDSYFDVVADAQALANERLALLKADRRMMQMAARGVVNFTAGLDYSQTTPAIRAIDDERGANFVGAIVDIGIDFLSDRTSITAWG